MKVVITTVDEAKKNELKNADGLAKSDLIVLISTKAKTEIPTVVETALEEVKAEVEFVKAESSAEVLNLYAYYAGLHVGKNHATFIVSAEKPKLPASILKQVKAYTNFKSVVAADGTTTASSGSKKTSSKKTTSSSSAKKTTAKKTTAKKTTTKKSTSSKKKSSKDADGISDVLESLASGKLDTDKLLKTAKKVIKDVAKDAMK